MSDYRALVFHAEPGAGYRAGRTIRSLAEAGIEAVEVPALLPERLAKVCAEGQGVLLVRAGAWLVNPKRFCWPLPSATGRPLCAIGATRNPNETDLETARAAAKWDGLYAETSGDFSRSTQAFPTPPAFFLDALALCRLAEKKVGSLEELWRIAADFRLVHYGPLDAYEDRGMRVLQVITSLQRGGAERVTLDLMAELPALNTRVKLATLGRALREAFPAPQGTCELAGLAREPAARAAEVRRICSEFGADLLHGHLLTAADARSISAADLPALLTVHNTRPGWPAGLEDLQEHETGLLAACARAVEADLQGAKMGPIRTVRNGIALAEFRPTPERSAAGKQWRERWGFRPDDFVMAAVANPRPQKRLHLLPSILAAVREKLGCRGREARLVFVGEVLRASAEAERCQSETQAETARLGLEAHVRWTGPVADVAQILAAADVLVSTSAHEGLSLAQVEALAMGCSVVATDVGGAREIAEGTERFYLVPSDASPEEFAEVLVRLEVARNRQAAGSLSLDWSRQRMAARYRWLYPRVIARTRRTTPGQGLWLVANNFSTGGAQASARRLLLGLQAQGVRVRAAVAEEDPAWPTPGHQALLAARVPVLAPPLDAAGQHEMAIEQILAAVDADCPQAVLFWNLRPSFKVALADALLDVQVFDVSPGEMFYDSMERYFAKPDWKFGCRTSREYGALLAGVIVKYRAEAQRAERFLGAPVHVVPNGVSMDGENLDFKACAAEKPERGGRVIFGTAARINPQKRLEDLIAAFHLAHDRLPPYALRIAGGVERGCAEYADGLKKACNGLPIEWLGEVTNVPAFHRELDAFAMISEPAGCPNASLEALAAGLPIVATDFGGASEQVINGQTGRLVPPRDPAAFAEALVEIATRPDLRRDMALAGQELIRARFSVEKMVADYRRICLVNEGPANGDSL